MPANLPPQYAEAEAKLKTAKTPQEKIKIYEELLAIMPKHKGTEKLQAQLKTKIAKLKEFSQKRPALAHHSPSYHIEKTGAGQVIVIGPPNSGKSMLIKALTGANPEVGEYPFTTRAAAPFMMKYRNLRIQLVDTPPLTPDDIESGFPELLKAGDALLVVVDLSVPEAASELETIQAKLKEKKVEFAAGGNPVPAENRPFLKKTVVAANKCDLDGAEETLRELNVFFGGKLPVCPTSAARGDGLEDLKKAIFSSLDIIRVYSKIPGKKADPNDPFALRKNSTVLDMAKALHKDFVDNFRYARAWRKNKPELQGVMVNRDFGLEDEDTVEIHI